MSDFQNQATPAQSGNTTQSVSPLKPDQTFLVEQVYVAFKNILDANEGEISLHALKKHLKELGVPMIEDTVKRIKLEKCYRFSTGSDLKWHHYGRSFYTPEKYEKILREEAIENEKTAAIEALSEVKEEKQEDTEDAPLRRSHNQEEKRLCKYVTTALEQIYESDYSGEHFAFNVCDERPSGDYRNVDLIAVDWRNENICELIAVEVKLGFNSKLVQQASNYTRFSNRVWIAVLIEDADRDSLLDALRMKDALLFDHVVELGLGILACRRTQGRSYEVFPIQWPRLQRPSMLELDSFKESYRDTFEKAGVLAPETRRRNVKTAA